MTTTSGDWSAIDGCDNCALVLEEKKILEAVLDAEDKEIVEKAKEYARIKEEFTTYKAGCRSNVIAFGLLVVIWLLVCLLRGTDAFAAASGQDVNNSNASFASDFKELYEEAQKTILDKDNEIQIIQKELERLEKRDHTAFFLKAVFIAAVLIITFSYTVYSIVSSFNLERKEQFAPWMDGELDRLCGKYIQCDGIFVKLFQTMMTLEVRKDRQSVKGELQTLEELYWNAAKNVEECITENVKAVEDKLKESAIALTAIDNFKSDAEEVKEMDGKEEKVKESHKRVEGNDEEIKEWNTEKEKTVRSTQTEELEEEEEEEELVWQLFDV